MNTTRSHLGFYEVNGKKYASKISAMIDCPDDQWVHWNFNDEKFSKHDWTVEPKHSLRELYKIRAIQLREKYDKLILFYSGGIDSTTMLRTFVDNDIKLDAVVSYGCFGIQDNKKLLRNLEVYKAAIPYVKELQKKTKHKIEYILLDDWAQFSNFQDESWVFHSGSSCLRPENYAFNFYHTNPQLQDIMSKGKTAILRGIDKPTVQCKDGKWFLVFLDKHTGLDTSGLSDEINSWYNIEYFYWTADLPELLCKQAHVIKKHFKDQHHLIPKLFDHSSGEYSSNQYNNYIDPLIYSDYTTQKIGEKRNYFSLGKSSQNSITYKDTEFFMFGDKKQLDVWHAGLDYCMTNVPDKYLHHKDKANFIKKGFVGCYSNPYYI